MDLFKLFGTVIIETEKAVDALEETSDEAKEASKSVKDFGDKSKKSGKTATDSMKPVPSKIDKIVKAGAALVGTAVAIGTAMAELAESTRDYRLEMGKLETAFESAGHTTEEANEVYQELYSILGETERAVEASQHIAKLCKNEEEMKAMTEACIGAFALFDDSLPIEGLMEASNETAKTGQLTGVLTDALNWAGSSEEAFQKKLDKCNTERERSALIIKELTDLYADSAEAYKKNNKDILAATSAQEKLTAATAKWGKIVEPTVTLFKEGLAYAINLAAEAYEKFTDPVVEAYNAVHEGIETSEQASEKLGELRIRLAELNETPFELRTQEQHREITMLTAALEEAENQWKELKEAERIAAEESSAATALAESAAKYSEITDQYVADAQTILETFAATYDGIYSKVASWFEPFGKATVTVRTNINDMMTAMQSQVDFNKTYSANLQALKEYGLGSLSDAFQSYGAEGSAYAQAIVDAVEKAGGATTEEGQAIIQGFADINEQVEQSEEELAETMTKMSGEFESALQETTAAYEEAIADLNKSDEASNAAIETFEGFLQGMNEKLPEIRSQMASFGQQITSALRSNIGSVNIPVTYSVSGGIPKHETGLDFVPYDNYLAYLHKGEAVLTEEEANAWRTGKDTAPNGNSMKVIQKSESSAAQNDRLESYLQSLIEMLADFFPQVIEASSHNIVTDDGAVIARYAPMFNTALGKISKGKDRGR